MYETLDAKAQAFRKCIGDKFIRIGETGISRQQFRLEDITPNGEIVFKEENPIMSWEFYNNTILVNPESIGIDWISVKSILNKENSKMPGMLGKNICRTSPMEILMGEGSKCYDTGFVENVSKLLGVTDKVMMLVRYDVLKPQAPFFLSSKWMDECWKIVG